MITLNLPRDPYLLSTAIEPTEIRPRLIDVSSRLAEGETLTSATVEDYGSGVITNVVAAGVAISCDVVGLANGSISLPVFTALGSLGSEVRFVLQVKCNDPAASVAAVVIAPDHAAATTPHVGVIGLLAGLLTTARGTLVAAVNELVQKFTAGNIAVDTAEFTRHLDGTADTVQKVAQAVDSLQFELVLFPVSVWT